MIATVSRNSLDKMLSGSAVGRSESPALHSYVVANLDALFERAIYGWGKPDKRGGESVRAIHSFFAGIRYGDESRLAKITVKEHVQKNQGNKTHSVEAVEFDKNVPGRK